MSTRPDSEGKKKSGPAWLGKRQAGGRVKQDPDWKKAKTVERDINTEYKVKRTLLWVVCITLFVLFVYFMMPPRNTPLVLFHARAYPLSMPPLALAAEDTVFLKNVSPTNLRFEIETRFNRKQADGISDEDSPQQLLARLKDLKPSGPGWFSRSGNVIIYVAAHGLVNDEGQACLVPPTSDPFEPKEWLPVEDFLRDICAVPKLQSARKIVILDCNRIGTRWRSGVLDNRFADQLKAAAAKVADNNLYILNSTSPGQVAWSAPELRGSIFGHFVGLGLRGDASVEFGRDNNRGVVSLLELYDYLCDHVDDYAQQRRGVRQTPLLIGPKGEPVKYDIPVVSADFWQGWRSRDQLKSTYDVLAKAAELIEPAGQRASPVQRAWESYQRRADGPTDEDLNRLPAAWRHGYVLDPIRFAELEQRLLALEERFVAGQEYQEELRKQWERLAEELADKNWRPFPVNQAATNLRLEDWQQRANEALTESRPERPVDIQAIYEDWLKAKTPEEKNAAQLPLNEQRAAIERLLYRYGVDGAGQNSTPNTLDKAELRRACEFLELMPSRNALAMALPIEGQFLRLLNGNVSEPGQRQLTQVLMARSLAERAATPNDVRGHYVIESLVNAADEERRQGEDAFFLGDPLSIDGTGAEANSEQIIARSAAQRLRRAMGFANDSADLTGYRGADALAFELEGMYHLRDRIWARLPHLAEWLFRRSRFEIEIAAGSEQSLENLRANQELLSALLAANVLLAEQLEQITQNRGQEAQTLATLGELRMTFDELQSRWRQVEKLAGDDASIIVDAESRFETQDAVRRIELIMQTPLVVDSRATQLLTKYRSTLDFWSKPENALGRSKDAPRAKSSRDAEAPADNNKAIDNVFLSTYSKFWVDYHRLLTHRFGEPYKNHLELLEVRDAAKLDQEVRRVTRQQPVWRVMHSLLSNFDEAFAKKTEGLSQDAKDLNARDELSQWDRRVRATAFWLPCVDATTISKTNIHSFPSARLRAVDHWHLTCWHAWRILNDFWGNGVLGDRGPMFFEQMAQQCRQAVDASGLPFRYEVPGGQVESLSRLLAKRSAARQGLSVSISDVRLADPDSPMPSPLKALVQQEQVTLGQDAARFPPGKAGFYLARPKSLDAVPEELARWGDPRTPHRALVPISDSERDRPPAVEIPADVTPKLLGSLPAFLDGRVWYRGQIWSDQFEVLYPGRGRGYRLEYEAKKYTAPSIQVTGNDAPSGAVMFVLDCSQSMLTPVPGAGTRFDVAKGQLKAILGELKMAVSPDLKIGLMAYAHRTPTTYYKRDPKGSKLDGALADLLDAGGLAAKGALADADFRRQFPHPDRDVEELVVPRPDWVEPIDEQLNRLQCAGETPLYYAIAEAIKKAEQVKGVESRQVIVVTDGVNFPYGGMIGGRFTELAAAQNGADYKLLTDAVREATGVKIRIVLFGAFGGEHDLRQLADLEAAGKAPKYMVDKIPIPSLIAEKIKATFEKTTYSVAPPGPTPPVDDWMPFEKAWIYPQWPAPRDLLPMPSQQAVEVHGPRIRNRLALDLELTGGEAIRLEYKINPVRLLFQSESLSPFKTSNLEAIGNAEPYPVTVLAEVLKPEPPPKFEETPETIATMFRVRLRSENNDTFVRRPRFVWAEIQPFSSDSKYSGLMFQISDLKFTEKTSTPVMEFVVPQWPKAVRSAKINLWVRYTAPKSALVQPVAIEPGEVNFLPIEGKDDLEGVTLRITQERKDGVKRIVTVTEVHPPGTQLANLYKTRVTLNPPASSIERMYRPADAMSQPNGEVVHTFVYDQEYLNDRLMLEVNSANQIKESSLRLKDAAPLVLPSWNP